MKGNIEPCSFFKYIFIDPKSFEPQVYEQVIAHEKIHVKQWHTMDILLSELAIALFWFNPVIWLLRKEVEKNIEYQTDDMMIKRKIEEKENYQLNLIKIAAYKQPLTITTNYNQSLITQRIQKINSKRSHSSSYWKYTFIAPIVFMLVLGLNKPNIGNAQIPIHDVKEEGSYRLAIGDEITVKISGNSSFEVKHMVHHDGFTRIFDGNQKIGINGSTLDQAKQKLFKSYSEFYTFKPSEFELTVKRNKAFGLKNEKEKEQALSAIESERNDGEPIQGCSGLSEAVKAENIIKIEELLLTVDPNCIEPNANNGWHPTHYAKEGHTPLSAAAKLGNKEIVELLINANADINFHDVYLRSPIMQAAFEGHFEMVKYLVDKGALINGISGNHGSALCLAARGGHQEIVEYLLDRGANINAYTYMHGTPFFSATRNGHTEIADLLIDKGASIVAQDSTQIPPLERAARIGNSEIVELLLSLGAEINPQKGKMSPLFSCS